MSAMSRISRWPVVLGAVLIQLCLGAIYAWSVFTPALKAEGWTRLETQIVFAVGLIAFAVTMVFAGRKLDTWGPQRLSIIGGLTLGGGYVLTGLLGATEFWVVCLGVGLMAIGLMKLYPMEALQAAGYSALEASAIAGTAMAVCFSLANGLGRIVWGTLSDTLGRKNSVIVMAGTQGLFLLAFTVMAGNEYLLYLGATLIGFNFGGNFALFPALTADEFGNGTVGQNYPYVFLSYGVGGIAFPILGGVLGDMGNFPMAFAICGFACLVGAAASMLLCPPDHDEAHQPISVHGFLHQLHLFEHRELEVVEGGKKPVAASHDDEPRKAA